MKPTNRNNDLIPFGSELRVLLNSDHISYGEVHTLLKRKGIFASCSEKATTVPMLSGTLLTPADFTHLVESSISRELRPKFKTSNIGLMTSGADWATPLKMLFKGGLSPYTATPNVEVVRMAHLQVESPTKLRVDYELLRRDVSQEWINREIPFTGEIEIELVDDKVKLSVISTHSSKETEAANRKLVSEIAEALQKAGVASSTVDERITFGSFQNDERVRFFKRLTAGLAPGLGAGTVIEMEINRDKDGPALPADPQVEWLNQTVRRLKIDGDKLNEVFLISDERYYKFYHVQRMELRYEEFALGTNSGSAKVSVFFSAPPHHGDELEDPELTFELRTVSHRTAPSSDAKRKIELELRRTIQSMIDQQYSRIVADRATDVGDAAARTTQ